MTQRGKTLQLRGELNHARLGILSMQLKVPEGETEWESRFQVAGRTFHTKCYGPMGRPHGLDGDVVSGITTLFVEADCPETNELSCTAYALRQACGWHNNGTSYQRLRESLQRLYLTSAVIREGLYDPGRKVKLWDGDTYRMIERFRFRDVEDPDMNVQLDGEGTLVIQLSGQFANSIRAGYVVALDDKILRALRQPTSRTLYRLLEAHRALPDGPEARVLSLSVRLMEWRTACGITSERPEIIRRTLRPAHEELLRCGYLGVAEFVGKGQKQTVEYTFGAGARDPDPDVVHHLLRHGVVRGVATKLALDHEREFLLEQVTRYETMLQSGLKPRQRGALLVDLIKNPGKYADVEVPPAPRALEDSRPETPTVEPEVDPEPETVESLARTLALLLRGFGLTKEELVRLPLATLGDLKQRSLGRPEAERADTAALARAILSSL